MALNINRMNALLLLLALCFGFTSCTTEDLSQTTAIPDSAQLKCQEQRRNKTWFIHSDGRAYFCADRRVHRVKICRDTSYPLVMQVDEETGQQGPACFDGTNYSSNTNLANFCTSKQEGSWLPVIDSDNQIFAMKCLQNYYLGYEYQLKKAKFCFDSDFPLVFVDHSGEKRPSCSNGLGFSLHTNAPNYCPESNKKEYLQVFDKNHEKSFSYCNKYGLLEESVKCYDQRFSVSIKENRNGKQYPICTDGQALSTHTNLGKGCEYSEEHNWFEIVDKDGVRSARLCSENAGYTKEKYCYDSSFPLTMIETAEGRKLPACTDGSSFSFNTNVLNYCSPRDEGKLFYSFSKEGIKRVGVCKSNNTIGSFKSCSDPVSDLEIIDQDDGSQKAVCSKNGVVQRDKSFDNTCSEDEKGSWVETVDKFGNKSAHFCENNLKLTSRFKCESEANNIDLVLFEENGKSYPRCMDGDYIYHKDYTYNECLPSEVGKFFYLKSDSGDIFFSECEKSLLYRDKYTCNEPGFEPFIYEDNGVSKVTCTDGKRFSENTEYRYYRNSRLPLNCPARYASKCIPGVDTEGDPIGRICESSGFLGERCSNPISSVDYWSFEATGWSPGVQGRVNYQTSPEPIAPPLSEDSSFEETVSFLIDDDNPSQFNLVKETLDTERISAIRGKVLNRNGKELSRVKVNILNRPEYGYVTTVSDGSFSIVVNGGATYVLELSLPGYLPSQRTIDVSVNAWTWLDDVVLIKKEPSKKIPIGEPSLTSSSEISDSEGTRSLHIITTSKVSAFLVKDDGTRTALKTLSISASEYTVGENGPRSMPATLPDASGYTYAVEIAADEEARGRVELGSPIYSYVSNFLDFPVGSPVPVGSYDSTKGVWVPEENGRVVAITGKTRTGLALIDIDGDGRPDSDEVLTASGFENEERMLLGEKYGDEVISLWRVPISSFGTKDYNWPYALPEGASKPDNTMYGGDIEEQNPCHQSGSVIDCHNQTFTEQIGIDGTPFSLVYSSKLASSRIENRSLRIPLTGSEVHPKMKTVRLKVSVAGKNRSFTYQPEPNLVHSFTWDGKDAWGRDLSVPQEASVSISYEYFADYVVPDSALRRAFGKLPEGDQATLSLIPGRDNLTKSLVATRKVWLGSYKKPRQRFGGWMLDIDSVLDSKSNILIDGAGSLESVAGRLVTLGGDLTEVEQPIQDAFLETELTGPKSITSTPKGELLLADTSGHRILKQNKEGRTSVFAGKGEKGFSGDGGPAIDARFDTIEAIAINPINDNLVLADLGNRRIRAITPQGTVDTIAGNGEKSCMQGRDFPIRALDASFKVIRGVNVSSDGIIYIADSACNRVYQLSPDGFITPFAGTGEKGLSGDGQSATSANLSAPDSIAVDINGYVYISEVGNAVIRVVRTDGTIFRVAGSGEKGNSGDGGSAALATFKSPNGMAFDQDGNLYIADAVNNNIRYIDNKGIIHTYLGENDKGSIIGRSLDYPHGVWFDGSKFYVAERDSNRVTVRKKRTEVKAGDVLSLLSEDGLVISHFNSDGKLLKIIDATLGVTLYTFTYDDEGRLESISDVDDLRYDFYYGDSDHQVETIVSPYAQETTLSYDSQGLLRKVTDSLSRSIGLSYRSGGDLLENLTLLDVGLTKSFEYDSLGNLTKDVDFNGSSKSIEKRYFEENQGYIVSVARSSGEVTTYEVFRDKRVTTYPDGSKTETVLDAKNNAYVSTSNDGVETVLSFEASDTQDQGGIKSISKRDEEGRNRTVQIDRTVNYLDGIKANGIESYVIELSSNDGSSSKTTFDREAMTLVSSASDGSRFEITYNEQGRIAQKRDLNNRFISVFYTYYPDGLLKSISQGDRLRSFEYNERGDIVLETYPDGSRVSYDYDYKDYTYRAVYPNGLEVKQSLDKIGRLKKLDVGSSTYLFSYFQDTGEIDSWSLPKIADDLDIKSWSWEHGRISSFTDEGFDQWVYGFKEGKIDRIQSPTAELSYSYEDISKYLDKIASPTTLIDYDWTTDKLSSETVSSTLKSTIAYGYDQLERLSLIQVGNQSIKYGFEDGILKRVGPVDLSWNAGLLGSVRVGSLEKEIIFNDYGDIKSLVYKGSELGSVSFTYSYDQSGLIKSKTRADSSESVVSTYEYNDLGELIGEQVNGSTVGAWRYDPRGNRSPRGPPKWSYNAQDQLLSTNSYELTYQSGRLAAKQDKASSASWSYKYSDFNHLESITKPDGSTIQYVMDHKGRRLAKKVDGALTKGFIYDGNLKPIAETDANGQVRSLFIYGSSSLVPDAMLRDGKTYQIISDHLGSPHFVVESSTGKVIQKQTWSAFGELLSDSNPGFQPFGFAGGIYDPDTKMLLYGSRSYDPELGRWLSQDPSGLGGGYNLYRYAGNNPINFVDPDGNVPIAIAPLLLAMTRGAVKGTLEDFAFQMFESGGRFECLDWQSLGLSALEGGLTGGLRGPKTPKPRRISKESAKKFDVPADRIGPLIGDLKTWGKTKGNFDIPKGTRNDANFLGESWVGPDAVKTPYKNQPGKFVYTSKDGTKQFREPVTKRDGRTLANFQWKDPATDKWIGNGHMTITD